MELAVQDKYAPNSTCHGCGPANEKGLRIKSFWEGDELVLRYTPEDHHRAFEGVVNGGIIASLFDCHMNWAAATKLYRDNPEEDFPSTVTAEFSMKLKRPTPLGYELTIKAQIKKIEGSRVFVESEMYADGNVTATSTGLFVNVKKGHPAYHRWT